MLDTRPFDIQRHLGVLPLFCEIAPATLARISEGSTLQRFERGQMVFRMGDDCDAFHVVVSGGVKLFVLSPAGQQKVIELIGPGQSFAEALMFLEKPCMVNAQCLAESLVLRVHRDAVVGELANDPRLAMRMLAGLSRRLHGLVQDVQAYSLQSGLQRVIGYLLRDQASEDEGDATAITVTLPVSKGTVASRLSVTPEYFSRVLRELEEAELIRVDKRDIHIPDVARLSQYKGA